MSGIGRGTRGIDTTFLYNLESKVNTPESFTLMVGDVTSIGDLTDSASTTEVNIYGEGYTNTFTTVKNIGSVDLEFLANTGDQGQIDLESLYKSQKPASFNIRLKQGDSRTDFMFTGQVSAFTVTMANDDIIRFSVTLVVHGGADRADAA